MKEKFSISGQWSAEIIRADGSVETFKQPNAIENDFKETLVDAMVTSQNTSFLFDSSVLHTNDGSGQGSNSNVLTVNATNGSGIQLNTGGSEYVGMQTTIENANNAPVAITSGGSTIGYKAQFKGVVRVVASYTITAIFLKRKKTTNTNQWETDVATGTGWNSLTINNGDQLTINWEISIQ